MLFIFDLNMIRKVSKHPAGSNFIYLPKKWYELQKTTGWDGKEIEITEGTITLLIKPHLPQKPEEK